MHQRDLLLLIVFFPMLISNTVFADGDLVTGEAIYATCAACHGQNGEGLQATNSPMLAGLRESHLVLQLQKIRSGLPGADTQDVFGVQMTAFAKALPDKQAILDVVAYIGTLERCRSVMGRNSPLTNIF